jgi:hypothetical protein
MISKKTIFSLRGIDTPEKHPEMGFNSLLYEVANYEMRKSMLR